MKKLLTLSAMTLLAVSAFGQGQVMFNNIDKTGTPNILAPIHFDSPTGAVISGTDARACLLGGPAATGVATTLASLGNLQVLVSAGSSGATWVNFRTGAAAGYVNVGQDGARVVPGVAYSGSAMLQMVAWTGNFTDWASAYNAAKTDGVTKIGFSNPWTVTVTTGPTDPAFPRNIGLESFEVKLVPEPSSLALAGLGAAAMLIFRRRK